jgi:hypothetical protein
MAILGWELWLTDHRATTEGDPISSAGHWCGLIPLKEHAVPGVIGGNTESRQIKEEWDFYVKSTITDTGKQISGIPLEREISEKYLPYIRINFTVSEEYS